jgi:carboxypeptidase C (cathepsin A)
VKRIWLSRANKKPQFDIGEMYAGNIPIGTNKSEALYFVFQPKLGAPVDEITIWLNGGPGCRYDKLSSPRRNETN